MRRYVEMELEVAVLWVVQQGNKMCKAVNGYKVAKLSLAPRVSIHYVQ